MIMRRVYKKSDNVYGLMLLKYQQLNQERALDVSSNSCPEWIAATPYWIIKTRKNCQEVRVQPLFDARFDIRN